MPNRKQMFLSIAITAVVLLGLIWVTVLHRRLSRLEAESEQITIKAAEVEKRFQAISATQGQLNKKAEQLKREISILNEFSDLNNSDSKRCLNWRTIWVFVANEEGATRIDGSVIPVEGECYLSFDGVLFVIEEVDGKYLTQFFQTSALLPDDEKTCPSGTKAWFLVDEFDRDCLGPPED